MKKSIFFDLDGTLTDSSEGITKCVQLALNHFGIEEDNLDNLRCFIGPPLKLTFPKFGISEENVEEAIKVFRSRYNTVGKFENVPYEGIKDALAQLKKMGHKLYVATSKPEITALQVLEKFEMTDYFEIICGATMDGTRDEKHEVIAYLLKQIGEAGEAVMVGDTGFDVRGAKVFDIPTLGVSWGFGSREEMLSNGAVAVVDTMDELVDFFVKNGDIEKRLP